MVKLYNCSVEAKYKVYRVTAFCDIPIYVISSGKLHWAFKLWKESTSNLRQTDKYICLDITSGVLQLLFYKFRPAILLKNNIYMHVEHVEEEAWCVCLCVVR